MKPTRALTKWRAEREIMLRAIRLAKLPPFFRRSVAVIWVASGA
jgi:hypothetical protein